MEGFDPALVASIIASTRRAKSLRLRQGTAHRGQSCPWPWELIACICHSPHRSQAAGLQGCPLITWRMSAMDQHYCSYSTPQRQHEPLAHGARSISARSQSSRPIDQLTATTASTREAQPKESKMMLAATPKGCCYLLAAVMTALSGSCAALPFTAHHTSSGVLVHLSMHVACTRSLSP